MTILGRTLRRGFVCAVLCAGGRALCAGAADNPYQEIVAKNVFSLRPTEPVPPPVVHIKPLAPKVILNGITTILGYKLALLTVQIPAKVGEPARQQSFMLREGERGGGLHVLQIDPTTQSVKVIEFDTEMTLTMDNAEI